MFGGVGIWGVGRGRRGKKRREVKGSRGKDDAEWRSRRTRGTRETRGRRAGRRTGGGARRGEGREMKKFYLHFQPFMQRLTPFTSLGLFLSPFPRARLNFLVLRPLLFSFFFFCLSSLLLLLPQPRFVPSTTVASLSPRPLFPSTLSPPLIL